MKLQRCLNPPLALGPDPLHSQSAHAQTRPYSFNSSPGISGEALLANHRVRGPHSGLLFLGFFSLFLFLSLSVAFFLFFPSFPSSGLCLLRSASFPTVTKHRPPRPLFFFFFFSRSLLRPIDHRFTRLAGIRSFC